MNQVFFPRLQVELWDNPPPPPQEEQVIPPAVVIHAAEPEVDMPRDEADTLEKVLGTTVQGRTIESATLTDLLTGPCKWVFVLFCLALCLRRMILFTLWMDAQHFTRQPDECGPHSSHPQQCFPTQRDLLFLPNCSASCYPVL